MSWVRATDFKGATIYFDSTRLLGFIIPSVLDPLMRPEPTQVALTGMVFLVTKQEGERLMKECVGVEAQDEMPRLRQ